MAPGYDRARQDMGNIVLLEHVNVTIPDQRLATIFYVSGLGLTRDPYLMTGVDNMSKHWLPLMNCATKFKLILLTVYLGTLELR